MSEQEIEKCNKVVELFGEMCEKIQDICIFYSQDFGFVVLEYFKSGCFESNAVYDNADGLFQHLLNKWKLAWVLEKKEESEIEEYDEFVEAMPDTIKAEFEQQVKCFEQKFAQIV